MARDEAHQVHEDCSYCGQSPGSRDASRSTSATGKLSRRKRRASRLVEKENFAANGFGVIPARQKMV